MSDIDGKLHFSPKYTFEDFETHLKNKDRDWLIEAFNDRICGFYLGPAEELNRLNKDKYAFAVGVLCVSTIDLLACITCRPRIPCKSGTVRERFEGWVKKNLTEFDKPNPEKSSETLAYRFYYEFRNGLVHEGRIKNGGQFSNLSEKIVDTVDGHMLVNPGRLLNIISDLFETYIHDIEKEKDDSKFKKLSEYLENLNSN